MAAPARGAVYGPIATPYTKTNTCVGERGSTVVGREHSRGAGACALLVRCATMKIVHQYYTVEACKSHEL